MLLAVSALALLLLRGAGAMQCPDGRDSCPSSTTCCILNDGSFACCPYKDAECCEDKIHCCPSGTRCNMRRQSCDSSRLNVPFWWMVPLYNQRLVSKAFPQQELSDVPPKSVGTNCPDGTGCPKKSTCCLMPQGHYGCCPYPNANCCSDQEHCCPSGFDCDVAHNRCISRTSFVSLFSKAPPKQFPIFNVREDVYEVPRGASCSSVNLCDVKGLVCCSGAETTYCCPKGSICSRNQGFCTTEMKVEVAATALEDLSIFGADLPQTKPEDVASVVCPDKTEACPSGDTCCLMASGNYGCCPFPQATCCDDLLHCCPNGYVCVDSACERQPLLFLDQAVFRQQQTLAPAQPNPDAESQTSIGV